VCEKPGGLRNSFWDPWGKLGSGETGVLKGGFPRCDFLWETRVNFFGPKGFPVRWGAPKFFGGARPRGGITTGSNKREKNLFCGENRGWGKNLG